MRLVIGIALALAVAAGALAQEGARWFVRASDAGVRLVGPTSTALRGQTPESITTAPGDYAVHFPRDAAGKPDSLVLSVPDRATVTVAVRHAAAAEAVTLEAVGDTNYLVASTAVSSDSAGRLGLVARRRDKDNWYRFVWDRDRGQFRLERSIGGSIIVISLVSAPFGDDQPHELALQVEGFRLRAFFDDALVLQALDGAHGQGGFATWQSRGTRVQWQRTVVERPAPPRPSSAVIATGEGAAFCAATGAAAGHHAVLELALDRPHALVPRTVAGLEPWLLQRPAAPVIVRGDFRGELGRSAISELPTDGHMKCGLRWPSAGALTGQAALVRALIVSPDGDRLVSRTPSAPVLLELQM